jgi:hypothetical protein
VSRQLALFFQCAGPSLPAGPRGSGDVDLNGTGICHERLAPVYCPTVDRWRAAGERARFYDGSKLDIAAGRVRELEGATREENCQYLGRFVHGGHAGMVGARGNASDVSGLAAHAHARRRARRPPVTPALFRLLRYSATESRCYLYL